MLAVRVILSLGAVFGAIWYLHRRLSKRAATTGREELIRVVGRKGVGAKAQVVVVDIAGSRYILGVTEGGVNVVDQMVAPEPEPAPEPASEELAHSAAMTTTPAPSFGSFLAAKQNVPFGPARPSLLSMDTWRAAARNTFGSARS